MRRRAVLSLAILALWCCGGSAQDLGRQEPAPPSDPDLALERRVMAFAQQMRCLVCQNETLADSQADLAVDLRSQIREQMLAGRTDAEITAFLTDRYGDFVR